MNVGDFGSTLVFGTGFAGAGLNMTAYTGLTLEFTRPDNTTLNVTTADGVTLGATNFTLPSGLIFNAHQYVTYAFLQGQVTVAGNWKVRLVYDQSSASPPIQFSSNVANFVVGS